MRISESPIRILLDANTYYVENQRRDIYLGRQGHPVNSVMLKAERGGVRPFSFTSDYEIIELVNGYVR